MEELPKLTGPDLESNDETIYPDVFEVQSFPDWGRVAIGSRSGEVELLLELCRSWGGSFGVLFVLLTSRRGYEPGRYESPSLDHGELGVFLERFSRFIEQDGRHHLWILSTEGEGPLVFDNHNLIYAYGQLGDLTALLESRGYSAGEVSIPDPHSHHYHSQFDEEEESMMTLWDWKRFPLAPGDDS